MAVCLVPYPSLLVIQPQELSVPSLLLLVLPVEKRRKVLVSL
jgi:hypothetical protein